MTGKPTVPPRIDPRADPDDDTPAASLRPPSSQRIDVVNIERTGDSISAVANTMRRELAKLHQQASAFERTLEDQRRERAEALDRAERATEHALSLEVRIARIEQENQQLRRMHETALDDLQKMRSERDDLASADAEIAALREKVERLTAELTSATGLAARGQSDVVKITQERDDAIAATARAAEAEIVRVRQSLEAAEKAVEQASSETTRLAREVEAAREERDAHVERAAMMERARIQVEDGVRQLRDEITTAFARIRLAAPSLAPPRPPSDYTPATRAATPLARRDELIAKLDEPDDARNAADALKTATEWLRGPPTKELLETLSHADYDGERPVFEVARAWEREPLCRAIIDALQSERDTRAREHHAWLVKNLAAPSMWKDIATLAANDGEATGVRRWLLEAIDRLVAARHIGWNEVGDLVAKMAKHPDATLRDGNIGILMSLEASDAKRDVLVDLLAHEDDELVLVGAIDTLVASGPIDLDDAVIAHLLEHPSDRVQRAAKQLLEDGEADGATIDVE